MRGYSMLGVPGGVEGMTDIDAPGSLCKHSIASLKQTST